MMKALILSGGKGTRLRPLTFTQAKQLIPIANKPNLFYVIEDILQAGISEIGIVISPETGEEIKTAVSQRTWDANFTFICQKKPLGLAHAVMVSKSYLKEDPFVMYLGDNLLSGGIRGLVREYEETNADSIVLLTEVENPSCFGVAILDSEENLIRLVEKPKIPPSNLALVGVYLFNHKVHKIIEKQKPSSRGEYEITDVIQGLIDQREKVIMHRVKGWWKDTGKPEDILEANHLILSQIKKDIQGKLENVQISGEVVVEKGAYIANSTLRGPIHIASEAIIENSYIGPYTSIGTKARIIRSEVEYSILLQEAQLLDLPFCLDASLIGQQVLVDGNASHSRKHSLRLILGDHSRVIL